MPPGPGAAKAAFRGSFRPGMVRRCHTPGPFLGTKALSGSGTALVARFPCMSTPSLGGENNEDAACLNLVAPSFFGTAGAARLPNHNRAESACVCGARPRGSEGNASLPGRGDKANKEHVLCPTQAQTVPKKYTSYINKIDKRKKMPNS